MQFGVANATDASDFNVIVESSNYVRQNIMSRFHLLFVRKRRPIYQNQVVGESFDRLHLVTQFTTNHLEVMRKIQKKSTVKVN